MSHSPIRLTVAGLVLIASSHAQESAPMPPLAPFENGRIERPPIPEDIRHPHRWRYTPPERIQAGSPLDRFLLSSFFSPVIFRDSDVGTGGGVALTDIDFRSQKYREFANAIVSYSSAGQQAYGFNWRRWLHHRELENGGIIRDERSSLFGRIGYSRTLTRRFFGLGSRTEEGAETSYTEGLVDLGLGLRTSLPSPGSDILLSSGVRFHHHQLSGGRVSDIPSTEESFPTLSADGDGVSQGWFDLGIAFDSRDSIHQPYSGFRVGLSSRSALFQSGGGFEGQVGGVAGLDFTGIIPVPALVHGGGGLNEENPPTDVVATHLTISDTYGDLPFYSLPSLGGSQRLRGYIPNRFTGRAMAYGSVEYRFAIVPRGFTIDGPLRVERVNLGLFYDVGTVASDLEQLNDGRLLHSAGVGLRFSFAREASFRLDLGVSEEGSNFSIRFGNAF